jgi:hypothetical protein
MLAAILRASSLLSNLAADSPSGLILKIGVSERLSAVVADDSLNETAEPGTLSGDGFLIA